MMFILEYLYNCIICVLYLFVLLLIYQIVVYIVQIFGIEHWFYDRRRRRYIGFVSVIIDYFRFIMNGASAVFSVIRIPFSISFGNQAEAETNE